MTTQDNTQMQQTNLDNSLRAEVKDLCFTYAGGAQILKNVNMKVHTNKITALIGPSGCGKSTLLRSLNRMHDLYPGNKYQGEITLYPENENLLQMDPEMVRMRVGMVFQKPNPFLQSIYENVASGLKIRGIRNKSIIDESVKQALQAAALYDEVKDRLGDSAYGMSGGQQQRLCIARALAPNPEILLLDEPTSALDPIATAKIEDLLDQLRDKVTVVIVTHNMQQASRISDYTAYMHLGELIEFGETDEIFNNPKEQKTNDYITGRFG